MKVIHGVLAIPLGKARRPWQIGPTFTPPKSRAIPLKVPRRLSILSLLALILLSYTGIANSAPILEIHDRLDVKLDPVRRLDDQAFVRGQVLQLASGEGAAYLEVRVRIDDDEATLLTDGAGYFSKLFEMSEGSHVLSVDVPGSEFLDAAHFEMADFDINKSPLSLTVQSPDELPDTADEAVLNILARSDTSGATVPVQVFFGSAGGVMSEMGTTNTAESGEAVFVLARDRLGAPGRKRIEIRFRGNSNYDAAIAGANLNLTGSSTLSLKLDRDNYDYGDTINASGRLLDGRGDPVIGAVVSMEVNSQRIGTAKTDERGDYRLKLDSEELGSGTTAMQSLYRPTESWNRSSQSDPVTLRVGKQKPVPIAYSLAAFALTSLALLSFVAMRTRPWERWLRNRGRQEDADDNARTQVDMTPPVGLALSRPKLSSTLRRAHYLDIDGVVQDSVTKEPIAGAAIEIAGPTNVSLSSASDGRFDVESLHQGDYQVAVRAIAYVTETFAISMPHRGELRATVIHMLPVREKIFSLYKEAVRDRLPDAKLWGIWTPRQILEHVRSQAPSERLSDLTDFVEETFFSARRPGEEMLKQAIEKIAAMRSEATSV